MKKLTKVAIGAVLAAGFLYTVSTPMPGTSTSASAGAGGRTLQEIGTDTLVNPFDFTPNAVDDTTALANADLTDAERAAYTDATVIGFSDLLVRIGNTAGTVVVLPATSEALLVPANGSPAVRAYFSGAVEPDLVAAAIDAGAQVRYARLLDIDNGGGIGFGTILLLLGVTFALVYFTRRGLSSASRSAVASAVEDGKIPATRFADIAGIDEAVEELTEIVEFMKDPTRFETTGAQPSRGALLIGPPGTGKTMLAKAVAGEAGVPFFAVSGSDFVEMYVGVGARRVRDLFKKARECHKAIVFIDEIDGVARRRRSGDAASGDSETERTLNALLVELDGFSGTHVVVLAATNRADILDEAIKRPGRLDRKITVPAPDRRGRQAIFEVYFRNRPIGGDVDVVHLARRTPGMTGAEIAQIVNEACLVAARAGKTTVDLGCFDAAIATVAMGRARTSAFVTDHDRRITAWHEAGHTVCALIQPDADDPVSVSIVPRGPAGGVTWMAGNDDVFLTRSKANARLVTSLGGRAAEMMLLDGEFTQGAHGDLEAATNLAMAMATQYGMTRLGLMVRNENLLATGGQVTSEVTEVVGEMLTRALVDARALLDAERDLVEALAEELLDKETLTHPEIRAVHDQVLAARRGGFRYRPLADDAVVARPRTARAGAHRAAPSRRRDRRIPVTALTVAATTGRLIRSAVARRLRRRATGD